ncbi:hypothetical protein EVAR_81722_1 [Eumeta japonica]|uniref:Uncharacterized protein n=1 Tax=Eumeta variegata TaxID=151549 RepID=A0A4C1UIP2_EUMVA|nr:hypothetical protein EVAR_81722_1 [Eumeta japonica]
MERAPEFSYEMGSRTRRPVEDPEQTTQLTESVGCDGSAQDTSLVEPTTDGKERFWSGDHGPHVVVSSRDARPLRPDTPTVRSRLGLSRVVGMFSQYINMQVPRCNAWFNSFSAFIRRDGVVYLDLRSRMTHRDTCRGGGARRLDLGPADRGRWINRSARTNLEEQFDSQTRKC